MKRTAKRTAKRTLYSLMLITCLASFSLAQDEDFSDADFDAGEETFDDELEESASEESLETFDDESSTSESVTEEPAAAEPPAEEPEAATIEESLPDEETFVPTPEPTPDPNVDTFAATPEPLAPDDPDLNYESQLYNIYVNFHKNRTPDEQWDALVGDRNSEIYGIQSGDTLWDISRTLFGDGNYWPKIWSLNGKISNPHLITPGNTIRFLLGDLEDAPAFAVTEPEVQELEKTAEVEAAAEAGVELKEDAKETVETLDEDFVDIPPPSSVSTPVLKNIPPSLPQWQSSDKGGTYDDLGIDYGIRPISRVKDQVALEGYILTEMPSGKGEVEEIEAAANLAGTFQYVYVKAPNGSVRAGDKLLCVKSNGKVVSDFFGSDSNSPGVSIEVEGMVEITEKVESKKGDEGVEHFRAMVNEIIHPVTKGCQLIEDKIRQVPVTIDGTKSNVASQIVGGIFDKRRLVFGPQAIVYLNRGEQSGITEGMVLPVRANREVRRSESKLMGSNRAIGWIRVVKVEPTVATAIIVSVMDDIRVGDFTGEGEILQSEFQQEVKSLEKDSDAGFDDDLEEDLGANKTGDDEELKVIEGDPEEDFSDENFDDEEEESGTSGESNDTL